MRIQIPDATAAVYEKYAESSGKTLDQTVNAQLVRFAALPPGQRVLTLAVGDVEAILGGLPVHDGKDLLHRISQLASISFHAIKLDFSPAQLSELEHRATRQGKTVAVLADDIVKAINREFFWASGGGQAAEAHPDSAPKSAPAR